MLDAWDHDSDSWCNYVSSHRQNDKPINGIHSRRWPFLPFTTLCLTPFAIEIEIITACEVGADSCIAVSTGGSWVALCAYKDNKEKSTEKIDIGSAAKYLICMPLGDHDTASGKAARKLWAYLISNSLTICTLTIQIIIREWSTVG